MGSPFKPLEPREQVVMQEMVNEYFARFVGIVQTRRPLREAVKSDLNEYKKPDYAGVFSGRVFSGAEGKERGLVDEVGLLPDAIELAKFLGNAKERRGGDVSASVWLFGFDLCLEHASARQRQQRTMLCDLPGIRAFVPAGFYYLWRPGI